MPVFEYHCEDCGADCEVFLRNQEVPCCPACQSEHLQRLMSAPAGHIAGSSRSLPIAGGCPPADAPPCSPRCCRLPQ